MAELICAVCAHAHGGDPDRVCHNRDDGHDCGCPALVREA